MTTQNTSSKILHIFHNNEEMEHGWNQDIYENWDTYADEFTYYHLKEGTSYIRLHPANKNECILITEENKGEHPEYFI